MNIILCLRGTSGSGKTTIARTFIEKYPTFPIEDSNSNKIWGYEVDMSQEGFSAPLFVIGSYATTCGGCDNINTQKEIAERALSVHPRGHVLIEGLLLAHAGPKAITTTMLKETNAYVLGYIDTPLDVCLDRVQKRRIARGDLRPFNPDNTISKHSGAHRTCINMHNIGVPVRTVDHTDAFNKTLEIYRDYDAM
jgi:adenylate kinase family enzyme